MSRLLHRSSSAQHRQSGFTLIELIVTLIVLGVIITLSVASPIRGALERHRVEGIQTELLTDLRRAQTEAAQRSGDPPVPVAMSFSGNADVSCYTIHTVEAGVACDCTQPAGSVCTPSTNAPEIKSMQFARADGVTVSASSVSTGSARVTFSSRGQVMPDDLVIEVQGSTNGKVRTEVSGLGVPRVCSPDKSIPGVAAC